MGISVGPTPIGGSRLSLAGEEGLGVLVVVYGADRQPDEVTATDARNTYYEVSAELSSVEAGRGREATLSGSLRGLEAAARCRVDRSRPTTPAARCIAAWRLRSSHTRTCSAVSNS